MYWLAFCMNFKDGETTTNVRFVEHYLPIKAAWAQQRMVKNIGAVGSSDDNNVGLFIKAIHLNQ